MGAKIIGNSRELGLYGALGLQRAEKGVSHFGLGFSWLQRAEKGVSALWVGGGADGWVVAMVVIDSLLTLWSHVGGDMRLDREVADCEGVGYHMVMDV